MRKLSLRVKLTLWFSAALALMAALTFLTVFSVSKSVLQKMVRDGLIRTVEDNVDEIEYYASLAQLDRDGDTDHYIRYRNGYLEIDDDFLDQVNGVFTALYQEEGELLYGENPIAEATANIPYQDRTWQKVSVNGVAYYLFDRKLESASLDGLWLRGVVSEKECEAPLSSIVYWSMILMPILVLIAVAGGNIIAGRTLRPIRHMSETAAQINGGRDLKRRIPVGDGADELSRLAISFNQMLDRLEEAFEAEKQFSSDVSHELRTPLSVIMAQCDYILEEERSPEEYRNALTVIRRQGGRMTRLLGDMLELLRMEYRTDGYARETLDMSELVESVAEDMALIQERGISLTFEADAGIRLTANRSLMTRLLTNLIGNAYRYGKENGHISVRLRKNGETIVLSVADDGIGIAPELHEKIFQRFYQAEPSRAGVGSGLGLSMVRQITIMHGGSITVDSVPGRGSVFTVLLPGDEKKSGERFVDV